MIQTIHQIRGLLASLETAATAPQPENPTASPPLAALICDVVDLLIPELRPLDAAIYLHLLRHSVIANGQPVIRASRSRLQSVVKAAHAFKPDNASGTSPVALRDAMTRLEAIGAIRQDGEPNRDGTLYRLLLPNEIKICRRRRAERGQTATPRPKDQESDYYNIRQNRLKIYQRDNYQCTYCSKRLTRYTATLDHVTPVSKGGDNTASNLRTACLQCNSRKTARPVGDFLAAQHPA